MKSSLYSGEVRHHRRSPRKHDSAHKSGQPWPRQIWRLWLRKPVSEALASLGLGLTAEGIHGASWQDAVVLAVRASSEILR